MHLPRQSNLLPMWPRKMSAFKYPSFDGIDRKIPKALPKKSILFLALIFNSMFRIHHLPTQWKWAVIAMVPKLGKRESLVATYQPVSLLFTFAKMVKRILLSRMMAVRRVQAAIPDYQLCLRSHHGTPEHAHRVTR